MAQVENLLSWPWECRLGPGGQRLLRLCTLNAPSPGPQPCWGLSAQYKEYWTQFGRCEFKFCLCHVWTRHVLTLVLAFPVYKSRALELIISKFLSVYDFSFILGLAAPGMGVGEPKINRVMGPVLTNLKVWTKR